MTVGCTLLLAARTRVGSDKRVKTNRVRRTNVIHTSWLLCAVAVQRWFPVRAQTSLLPIARFRITRRERRVQAIRVRDTISDRIVRCASKEMEKKKKRHAFKKQIANAFQSKNEWSGILRNNAKPLVVCKRLQFYKRYVFILFRKNFQERRSESDPTH